MGGQTWKTKPAVDGSGDAATPGSLWRSTLLKLLLACASIGEGFTKDEDMALQANEGREVCLEM